MRLLSPMMLSLILACGGSGAAGGGKVDKAVSIAKELRAQPDDAEKILERHGMSAEQWESLMYEIAGDPALAAEYEAGLHK